MPTLDGSWKPASVRGTLISLPMRELVSVKLVSGLVNSDVVEVKLKLVSSPNLRFKYLVASAATAVPFSIFPESLR